MRLRALRLHGFKSFADRTEVLFHDGITAIVGPNGCGKSNISDAIRWVLGEQRAAAIRGAKMEEAIFQGTTRRRPVNRGSVSMEFENEGGLLPVPFQEVEISRTVYRDGGSDYALNRTSCRLRDIQDLFRDTGLGANAYSVIENRMIDAILSDRAEERRALFEEAAGIGKYKDRRKGAQRRLERAEVDLQRLEDLISEVQGKVRSLARQRGRAERYHELRRRKLDVEVSLAGRQIEAFDLRIRELQERLTGDGRLDQGLLSEVAIAESRLETLRIEQLQSERLRGEMSSKLEEVRGALTRWERELAVAAERSDQAERRLVQLLREREEVEARTQESSAEEDALSGEVVALEGTLAELIGRMEEESGRVGEVRQELARAREALELVERREREHARRAAQLQGEIEGGELQRRDLQARIVQLQVELDEARGAHGRVASQGDLFSDRLTEFERLIAEAKERVGQGAEEVRGLRAALDEARRAELEAQGQLGELRSRVGALERIEADGEGMDPVVRALLQSPPEGVLGILADFMTGDPEAARLAELSLGAHLRALVVRDSAVAGEVARWFRAEWEGRGGLLLLPLDRLPAGGKDGRGGAGGKGRGGRKGSQEEGGRVSTGSSLLDRIQAIGEGGRWVEQLLEGVELLEGSEPGVVAPGREGMASDGGWMVREGIVRLGNPFGGAGILERKERLRELRGELPALEAACQTAATRCARLQADLTGAEGNLEEGRGLLREREDALRSTQGEVVARSEELNRLERTVLELEARRSSAQGEATRLTERVAVARREFEGLHLSDGELREERGGAAAQVERVQERWELLRGEEGRLTLERMRLEGERARREERRRDLQRQREFASRRGASLVSEEEALRATLQSSEATRQEGTAEVTRLFELREGAQRAFEEADSRYRTFQEGLVAAERGARELRTAERAASERRHQVEMELRGVEGERARVRDRLEIEWGRSLEELWGEATPCEGSLEELTEELREVAEGIERLGLVNMLAVEEHEEESTRLAFLTSQRDDLVAARGDLRAAIREINQTATELFTTTFDAIRTNFRETFQHLFEGGECDLRLADPEDPLESEIDIQAAPRGKRTQRIDLLSGGERALTALSLLFGIYLVKPTPFCVLDEVDAPLDESNIGRFIRLLQDFKARSQFIVITHNPRTIEAADWIYGVTMEEPGVSTIVGVRLEEALEVAGVR